MPGTASPTTDAASALPDSARSSLLGFLNHLQAECGLSLNTRKAYRRDLTAFLSGLAGPTAANLGRLTPADIEGFMRHSKALGHAVATIARQLAAVRMFCRYLVLQHAAGPRRGRRGHQPPKKWSRLPDTLSEPRSAMLLSVPHAGAGPLLAARPGAADVLYASGMRAAEAAGLRLADVNFNLGVIRVLGKGNKERIVPVAEPALDAVRQYVDHRAGSESAASIVPPSTGPCPILSSSAAPAGR